MPLKVMADQVRDFVGRGVIDYHAELRPAVDSEGGKF